MRMLVTFYVKEKAFERLVTCIGPRVISGGRVLEFEIGWYLITYSTGCMHRSSASLVAREACQQYAATSGRETRRFVSR